MVLNHFWILRIEKNNYIQDNIMMNMHALKI